MRTVTLDDDIGLALERFGRDAGSDGWDLDHVVGWVDALGSLRAGRHLTSPAAASALVRGWAAGATHGGAERRDVDPDTGLVTVDVLAARLTQVYERCRTLGVPAHHSFAIGIVDLQRPAGLRGHAVSALVGSIVAGTFRAGELCVALRRRVAVLAPSTPALGRRLSEIADAARRDPVLAGSGLVTWIEPLPTDVGLLGNYLADLDL